MRKLLLASAGVVLAAALTLAGSVPALAASAQARAAGWFTVTGTVTGASGPVSSVTVLAEPDSAAMPVGSTITTPVVGQGTATGSSYSVRVRVTPKLLAMATNGYVNLDVLAIAQNGRRSITFTYANVSGGTVHAGPMSSAPAARSAADIPRIPGPGCGWTKVGQKNGVLTRIGELHVAPSNQLIGTYSYTVSADSSVSVGVSFDNSNYGADGTSRVSNSIGAGSSSSHQASWSHYVLDHMNYGRFIGWGCETGWSKVVALSSNGDVPDGYPAPGPRWSCGHDPNGYATIGRAVDHGHPGEWHADISRAKFYSGSATVFGFSFGDSTGFSTNNHLSWQNYSTRTYSYVCGDRAPVQESSVLYNQQH